VFRAKTTKLLSVWQIKPDQLAFGRTLI